MSMCEYGYIDVNNWVYVKNNIDSNNMFVQYKFPERTWEPDEQTIKGFDEITKYAKEQYPDIFINDFKLRFCKILGHVKPILNKNNTEHPAPSWCTVPKRLTTAEFGKNPPPNEEWDCDFRFWSMSNKEKKRIRREIDSKALHFRMHTIIAHFAENFSGQFFGYSHLNLFSVVPAPGKPGVRFCMGTPEDYLDTELLEPIRNFFRSVGKVQRKYVNTPKGFSIYARTIKEAQQVLDDLENYLTMF